MRRLLAEMFAGPELRELERWRSGYAQYHRWLAEFSQICLTLENLSAYAQGKQLDSNSPPGEIPPWGIEGLRHHLRLRERAPSSGAHEMNDTPRRPTDDEIRAKIAFFEASIEDDVENGRKNTPSPTAERGE